ncbi:MAG: alpha/beta hydrolase [Terriglobus roseus]|nr:alpha/beta hydrolase [Terriglobus roseus]
MALPTIILTPGAWHSPDVFTKIIPKLEAAGHKVITVDWPSCAQAPQLNIDADIALIRSVVAAEADAGRDMVIVAHSWAGAPVVSAVGDFAAAKRRAQGEAGGVVALAFMCAFVVPKGVSLFDALGREVPALWNVQVGLAISKLEPLFR